jgi:hypothetical protein
MSNGDGGTLKINAIIHLDNVDRGRWHIEAARHLRFFADQIETNGLDSPYEVIRSKDGRGYCVIRGAVRP